MAAPHRRARALRLLRGWQSAGSTRRGTSPGPQRAAPSRGPAPPQPRHATLQQDHTTYGAINQRTTSEDSIELHYTTLQDKTSHSMTLQQYTLHCMMFRSKTFHVMTLRVVRLRCIASHHIIIIMLRTYMQYVLCHSTLNIHTHISVHPSPSIHVSPL